MRYAKGKHWLPFYSYLLVRRFQLPYFTFSEQRIVSGLLQIVPRSTIQPHEHFSQHLQVPSFSPHLTHFMAAKIISAIGECFIKLDHLDILSAIRVPLNPQLSQCTSFLGGKQLRLIFGFVSNNSTPHCGHAIPFLVGSPNVAFIDDLSFSSSCALYSVKVFMGKGRNLVKSLLILFLISGYIPPFGFLKTSRPPRTDACQYKVQNIALSCSAAIMSSLPLHPPVINFIILSLSMILP